MGGRGDTLQTRHPTGAGALLWLRLGALACASVVLAHPGGAALVRQDGRLLPLSLALVLGVALLHEALRLGGRLRPLWIYAALCCDVAVAALWIDASGGLRSPLLSLLLLFTGFFVLFFPRPIAPVPALLALAGVAQRGTPGDGGQLFDLLVLLSHTILAVSLTALLVHHATREARLQAERRRLEASLAVAEERSRLSREIHDGLGGLLTAALFQSEGLAAKELRGTLRAAMEELRRSLRLLRGEAVAAESPAAVCRQFQERWRLPVRFEERGNGPPLSPSHALSLQRILQESLSNAARHARAKEIRVSLERSPDQLRLSVQDDGAGFDPAKRPSGHYGLTHLEERARLLGAELTIRSAPGAGTLVRVAIPHGPRQESR